MSDEQPEAVEDLIPTAEDVELFASAVEQLKGALDWIPPPDSTPEFIRTIDLSKEVLLDAEALLGCLRNAVLEANAPEDMGKAQVKAEVHSHMRELGLALNPGGIAFSEFVPATLSTVPTDEFFVVRLPWTILRGVTMIQSVFLDMANRWNRTEEVLRSPNENGSIRPFAEGPNISFETIKAIAFRHPASDFVAPQRESEPPIAFVGGLSLFRYATTLADVIECSRRFAEAQPITFGDTAELKFHAAARWLVDYRQILCRDPDNWAADLRREASDIRQTLIVVLARGGWHQFTMTDAQATRVRHWRWAQPTGVHLGDPGFAAKWCAQCALTTEELGQLQAVRAVFGKAIWGTRCDRVPGLG